MNKYSIFFIMLMSIFISTDSNCSDLVVSSENSEEEAVSKFRNYSARRLESIYKEIVPKAMARAATPEDVKHLNYIDVTLYKRNISEGTKKLFHNHRDICNEYQASTYAMISKSTKVTNNKGNVYFWVSQDYLLSAANLAKLGVRVKSYTIKASIVRDGSDRHPAILESSPDTTNPTQTVTSSLSLPLGVNSSGGVNLGITPGWSRSFTAPSTKVKKQCDAKSAKVKWVYEIHRKSPIATSDFDPTQKWVKSNL